MVAPTPATVNWQRTNVDGSYRDKLFSVTGDNFTDFDTGLKIIKSISFSDETITNAYQWSKGRIFISASGAFTGALIRVVGI